MAWDFNYNTGLLHFKQNPGTSKYATICHRLAENDANSSGNIWNNAFLLKYAIALTKIQWANNLGGLLVNGVTAPGGANVDFGVLYQQGNDELTKLEEEGHEHMGQQYFNIYMG